MSTLLHNMNYIKSIQNVASMLVTTNLKMIMKIYQIRLFAKYHFENMMES